MYCRHFFIISLSIIGHGFDRLLIRLRSLILSIKFTFFNKQHQRADTATNSQTGAMLEVTSCLRSANSDQYILDQSAGLNESW